MLIILLFKILVILDWKFETSSKNSHSSLNKKLNSIAQIMNVDLFGRNLVLRKVATLDSHFEQTINMNTK